MFSSFNAFGKIRKEYGNPSTPVWCGKERAVPVGGTLDRAYLLAGALYAAGTPVELDGKTIKVLVNYKVVSFTAGETDDTIVVAPYVAGEAKIAPSVDDIIIKIGDSFTATGVAAKVKTVAAVSNGIQITVNHTQNALCAAGDFLTPAAESEAGSGKSLKAKVNGYLCNDIYLGDIDVTDECAGASGAVVKAHAEGILINRTPAADFKAQMAKACPAVIQVNY